MRRFIIYMLICCIVCLSLLLLLNSFYKNTDYLRFGFICTAVFILSALPVGLFFKTIVKNSNRTLFISATIGNMLFKILLAFFLIFIYYRMTSPADGNFILYFLLVYGIFTIFETYLLLGIAEHKPGSKV